MAPWAQNESLFLLVVEAVLHHVEWLFWTITINVCTHVFHFKVQPLDNRYQFLIITKFGSHGISIGRVYNSHPTLFRMTVTSGDAIWFIADWLSKWHVPIRNHTTIGLITVKSHERSGVLNPDNSIVCSTAYPGWQQRKHQSPVLSFIRVTQWRVAGQCLWIRTEDEFIQHSGPPRNFRVNSKYT